MTCPDCERHRLAFARAVDANEEVERDYQACLEELDETRKSLDVQHAAADRAIARWRAERPEEREHFWPDRADLLVWLMAEVDRVTRERDISLTRQHYREERIEALEADVDRRRGLHAALYDECAALNVEVDRLRRVREEAKGYLEKHGNACGRCGGIAVVIASRLEEFFPHVYLCDECLKKTGAGDHPNELVMPLNFAALARAIHAAEVKP